MFVQDDNNKIIKLLNHLFLTYLRFLKKKKLNIFINIDIILLILE